MKLKLSYVFLVIAHNAVLTAMSDALIKNQDKKSIAKSDQGSVRSFKKLIEDTLKSKPEQELFSFFSPLFDELAEQKELLKLEALAEVLTPKVPSFSSATATVFEDYMQRFLARYKVLMAQPCFKKIDGFSLALKKRANPNYVNTAPAQNFAKNEHCNLNEPVAIVPSSMEKNVEKYMPITIPADFYEDSLEKMKKDYEKRQERKKVLLAQFKKARSSNPSKSTPQYADALQALEKAEIAYVAIVPSFEEAASVELPKWTAKRVAAQQKVSVFLKDAKRPLSYEQKDSMVARYDDLYHQIENEKFWIYSLDHYIKIGEEALLALKKAQISYEQEGGVFDPKLVTETRDIENLVFVYGKAHLSALTAWKAVYRDYVTSYHENLMANLDELIKKFPTVGREAVLLLLTKTAPTKFTHERVCCHLIHSLIEQRDKMHSAANVALDLLKQLEVRDVRMKKAYENLLKQTLCIIERIAKIAKKYEEINVDRCAQELLYIERLYQKLIVDQIPLRAQTRVETQREELEKDKQRAQKALEAYEKILAEFEVPLTQERIPVFLQELLKIW